MAVHVIASVDEIRSAARQMGLTDKEIDEAADLSELICLLFSHLDTKPQGGHVRGGVRRVVRERDDGTPNEPSGSRV